MPRVQGVASDVWGARGHEARTVFLLYPLGLGPQSMPHLHLAPFGSPTPAISVPVLRRSAASTRRAAPHPRERTAIVDATPVEEKGGPVGCMWIWMEIPKLLLLFDSCPMGVSRGGCDFSNSQQQRVMGKQTNTSPTRPHLMSQPFRPPPTLSRHRKWL